MERIRESDDTEVTGRHRLNGRACTEQRDPSTRPCHREDPDASCRGDRDGHGNPRDTRSAGELPCADVGPDHRDQPCCQSEDERIQNVLETHSGAEAGESCRAQCPHESREQGKREVVEDRLERHRSTHAQDLHEQPSVETDVPERQRDGRSP